MTQTKTTRECSCGCRTCQDQDQDQDSLLVKRRNDNHSPGPVIRECRVVHLIIWLSVFVRVRIFWISHIFVISVFPYTHDTGDYESMRKDTLEFAKEKYFNGHSDTRSVQENFDLLTSFIQDSADTHIPSKTSRSVSSIPWFTPEIRRKIRRKNKTHAKAKKTGSSKLRSKFETLRREIKADVRKQHDLYVTNLVGDVKANPRDFYRYINSQKKDTQGIPPLKRKNGKGVAQSDLEKAEEFNGQFTDVFNKNEHTQVPLLDRSAPFMNDIAVSMGLNPSKALGPDELHPRVLKALATELDPVFAHIFQQ